MAAYVAINPQRHHPCRHGKRNFAAWLTGPRLRSTLVLSRFAGVEHEDPSMVCKKCLVGGRVQGVFYRATAAHRARELGIHGHARNLPDGRVEVLVCGDEASVEAFVEWLWIGSSASKVTSVDVADADAASVRPGFRTG